MNICSVDLGRKYEEMKPRRHGEQIVEGLFARIRSKKRSKKKRVDELVFFLAIMRGDLIYNFVNLYIYTNPHMCPI